MSFFVKFWGTRGSIPTPGFRTSKYGGNTSCVEIRIGDLLCICDAGSGLREMGLDLMQRTDRPIIGHMFFSHSHWDHIQGFPFFLPAYSDQNTFYVYGPSLGDTRFFELLSGQMRTEYFPINFSDLKANILPSFMENGVTLIDDLKIRCLEQIHQGTSYAYSFEKNGYKIVYATDHELDLALENHQATLKNLDILRLVKQPLVDFVRDADLLIADGQYSDSAYGNKVGWGHSRATTLVDLALQADAKQVAVFHHDPLETDLAVEEKISACRKRAQRLVPQLSIFAAREGVEIKID